MSAMENDETLQMFLEEARDHLRDIEADLMSIETETGPADVDLVNKVFRGIHSIKGAAGFFGLNRIKELSHSMENLLNRIRNLEIVPAHAVIEALLKSADILTAMVNDPAGSENFDIAEPLAVLRDVQSATAKDTAPVDIADGDGHVLFRISGDDLDLARKGGKNIFILAFDMVEDIDKKGKTPLALLKELEKTGLIVDSSVAHDADGNLIGTKNSVPFHLLYATVLDSEMTSLLTGLDESKVLAVSAHQKTIAPSKLASAAKKAPSKTAKAAAQVSPKIAPEPVVAQPATPEAIPESVKTESDAAVVPAAAKAALANQAPVSSTLRVNVKVLDRLMTLAGELVLSRNQLMQKVGRRNLAEIGASSQGLSMIISELQEAVMSTRMQPLSSVFGKFQRIVRDMAQEIGKEIRLDVEGEDVELDKAVIESIGDPLTHLIRNSVDHGVETPEQRERLGKPRQAVIKLHAYHEAGKVVIEVSDNGRGIDTDAVREKAASQKLIDPQHLGKMTEKELINLIFLPGFSTAKKITDISGRGVGMDVVKTNFTKLGGVIDIESKKGYGTKIRVKLPLTLAIIPSLMMSVADETYAIPQVNLVELVRIPAKDVRNRIERIGEALVMRLRGHLLPVLKLSQVLGIEQPVFVHPESGEKVPERRERVDDRRGAPENWTAEQRERRRGTDRRFHSASAVNIAVLSAGTFQYGLIVDRLHESEEIVVKPLGRHFRNCACYAGATILGDGRVSLILDVVGVTRYMNLSDVSSSDRGHDEESRSRQKLRDAQSMLLFKVAEHEQFAVPLSLISRLEVIPRESIEEIGGRRTVQYRGGSLPLLDLADVAQVHPLPDQETYFVIVYAVGGKEVGLVVSQIVDIVEASVDFDESTFKQPGIIGSTILSSHTTLLVDLYEVVKTSLPGWIKSPEFSTPSRVRKILVTDDSPFYRRQIVGFLKECGVEVVEAVNGDEALAKLETTPGIELVLTDVEMPIMDGLELTRRIRGNESLRHLPVIAITSLSGEEAVRKGKEAGVDGYLVKLDREKILAEVEKFLLRGKT
ncbi:MAG: chemotaxis protein CheW [Fibrobacterota bacterium]